MSDLSLKYKKIAIYSKLHKQGLISKLSNTDTIPRLGLTADEVIQDIEDNFSWIIKEPTKPTIIFNSSVGKFSWNDSNYPLIKQSTSLTYPGIYIWQTTGNITLTDDAKLTPLNNTNCITSIGSADNLNTYNNKMFAGNFKHSSDGSITPLVNNTRDAYYDVNISTAVIVDDVTYDMTDYHVTYYVWYIVGNGIDDYEGYGGIGLLYPYEVAVFPYRHYNVTNIPTINLESDIHVINTESKGLLNAGEHTLDGYNFYLTEPDKLVNFVVRGDFNTLPLTGQKYAYQGISIKTFEPFTTLPSTLIAYVNDDEEFTLDVTDQIEATLTWDFPNIEFIIDDNNIATINVSSMNDGTISKIIGPNISITGKKLGNTNLRIRVYLQNSTTLYKEYIIPLIIEEKNKNVVSLQVTNYSVINANVSDVITLNISTNATEYIITPDISGRFEVDGTRLTCLSEGSGYIYIKGKRDGYKSTTLKLPYAISKFQPTPYIKHINGTTTIDGTDVTNIEIETNCDKSYIEAVINNEQVATLSEIKWLTETDYTQSSKFKVRTANIKIVGLRKGNTVLGLTGRYEGSDKRASLSIPITILNLVHSSDVGYAYTNQISNKINKEDTYVRFHIPSAGVSSIIVARGNTSRVVTIPKITDKMIADNNGSTSFTLVTEEEFYNNVIDGKVVTNPNSLDKIVNIDPTGNGIFLNDTTGEVFIDGKGTHR